MNIAAEARAAALPIEMKKHAYRQTQDGIVISFVVHPNDVSPALAAAALGTRYMCALVEMSGDETPVSPEEQAERTKPAKERKRWSELPLSQQAAIRCNEADFATFLHSRDTWFATSPEMTVSDIVRQHCGVNTRKLLDTIPEAAARWQALDADYRFWLQHREVPHARHTQCSERGDCGGDRQAAGMD